MSTYLSIPYMPTISEKYTNFFRGNQDICLAYRGINKLSKFIKVCKDRLPKDLHTNIVYKINCMSCDASYVEQIGRLLKTRIGEHRNHINRNTAQLSVMTEHRIVSSHEFN